MNQSRISFTGLGLGLFLAIAVGSMNTVQGADDIATKCGQVIQNVLPCLDFATGKADKPKQACCDATSSMKETNPECLCYIIQETHKGSPQVKELGIQEAKLLQLPSVCSVKNASITNCPKLLGLSPNSPDAAIFTNSSKATPSTTPTTTTPSSSTPQSQSQNSSYGSLVRPSTIIDVIMMGLAIVVLAIPTGFVSI